MKPRSLVAPPVRTAFVHAGLACALVLATTACERKPAGEPAAAATQAAPAAPAAQPRAAHPSAAHPSAILPRPAKFVPGQGAFAFGPQTAVAVAADQPGARRVGEFFAQRMLAVRGFAPKLQDRGGDAKGAVELALDPKLPIGEEAYVLDIGQDGAKISARSEAGLFYGAVSLWQLASADGAQGATEIAAQRIEDAPAYRWRGLMLDVARHFRSVEEVKAMLDQMALLKLNTFHWHLTDDQGWRIEIKKYPRLTEVGGCRVRAGANGRDAQGKSVQYCGFYTQEQIRDVVAYAAARHINVVPEIEMPGHAQAAIAAYPALGVGDVLKQAPTVSSDWGVHTYLFNPQDQTFAFLSDVLDEVVALFPSKYIHIGGDEAAKDQWQLSPTVRAKIKSLGLKNEAALQSWFVGRIGAHLQTRGRVLVGWDEILEGGTLPASATVMSWRGDAGALEATRKGHDVILAPDRKLYLDYAQSDRDDEPSGRFPVAGLRAFYEFPMTPPGMDAQQAAHVIGAQGNLWTEHKRSFEQVQRALHPRLDALAEVVWSPAQGRDWNDFQRRLVSQLERYKALKVGFSDAAYAVDFKAEPGAGGAQVTLSTQTGFGEIRYRTDGGEPDASSPVYSQPLQAALPLDLVATAFFDGHALSAPRRLRAKTAADLSERGSARLKACREGYNLRLEDDATRDGRVGDDGDGARAALTANLIDPCWIYPGAKLDGVAMLRATVGQVPYNFQLWHDTDRIVTRKAEPDAALEVRLNDCKSAPIARLPLQPALASDGLTVLEAPLPKLSGSHDLCFVFASGKHDPLWALDRVSLRPAP
ncbi:beta-hexosaminidase [Lysobacter enzymogenes]|uniref:beta-N-acetylhexosaminidase n=1 Tax=Lysobacter enzymogenes TaxID=69 RepID=A0A0S2DPD7_LYSEN|nr:family 20 glycosylhydrolase [Lysobacter enzymogenes]ALN60502.1 beta-hexosaminidase [Lysobacter enzymogenes]QCW28423.1 beta-hexosaminidase [Lysobacter enzymogenes]